MDRRRKHKNKNKKGTTHGSNEKKTARKSSGKEYLKKMDFKNINITNPEEFLSHTINNMEESTKAMKMDPCNVAKRAAIEDELKPMNVTPKVKERIKDIPRSKAISWYIDINRIGGDDITFLYCNIHLVDEKSLLDHESKLVTCIGVSMSIIKNKNGNEPYYDLMRKEKEVILGTFAKICLEPDSTVTLRGLCNGQSVLPAEVILKSSGLVDRMKPDLMELGVSRVSIAHSGLIADGKKSFKKTVIHTRPYRLDTLNSRIDRDRLCENIRSKCLDNEEQYVSEEIEDLNGWVPPDFAPAHWFVKTPELYVPFDPYDLLGWRTNLERAIENADESKVIEITTAHSAEEVRDFCEIRLLLLRMAAEGLKESCRLLIDYCYVSVEGPQAPYIKDEWRHYMKLCRGGGLSLTPLIAAAYMGNYEVCELLLDRNANVNGADTTTKSTVLQQAVAQGHKDVVKLLCKRNADIAQVDCQGYDSIYTADFIVIRSKNYENTGCTTAQCERIAEILREYDYTRCSYCRFGVGLLKQCPCHKERYCNETCQLLRWHCHKDLHKKAMRKMKCANHE